MTTRSYGGGYSYSATRYTTLRLGYSRAGLQLSGVCLGAANDDTRSDRFDAGMNYSRPLSISRRTTLSFGTGSAAIDNGTGDVFHRDR